MIIDEIMLTRNKYQQANFGREPLELVAGVDVAYELMQNYNRMMPFEKQLICTSQIYGCKFFGMTITRWPDNPKGFAVR